MKKTKNKVLEAVTEAIQERKGQGIVWVDLRGLDAICDYFVICEGNSNTQILSIADHIEEFVRENVHAKPLATTGEANALWVAMDYGEVMVHIFDRESRRFYDLEHLWSDAVLTEIESD